MRPSSPADATPAVSAEPGFFRSVRSTRFLLSLGVLVGPFYLAVGLAQALVRDGFDLGRHPLSVLANGPGGWVQTANFLVSGLMVIGAAVSFARVLRPWSRAAGWVLGGYGACLMLAAVFRADPVDGFPIGTPEGPPTTMSTSGLLHFVAGGIGFLTLAMSCFLVAAAMARRGASSFARLSLLCGLAVIGGFIATIALPSLLGTAGIWFSVVAGWAWLTIISLHLYRLAR